MLFLYLKYLRLVRLVRTTELVPICTKLLKLEIMYSQKLMRLLRQLLGGTAGKLCGDPTVATSQDLESQPRVKNGRNSQKSCVYNFAS